jgi:hypothetical protein
VRLGQLATCDVVERRPAQPPLRAFEQLTAPGGIGRRPRRGRQRQEFLSVEFTLPDG